MATSFEAQALPEPHGLSQGSGRLSLALRVAIAVALLILALFPMYWIIISSLKTNSGPTLCRSPSCRKSGHLTPIARSSSVEILPTICPTP